VHFWIVKTGEDLQMWGYPTKVRELAWDPTSRYLATGGGVAVTVWDCSGKGPAGTRPLVFEAHEAPLSALAFQGRGPLLASGGQDGLVALWRPGMTRKPLALATNDAEITRLAWAPDDRSLAIGSASGTVVMFATPGA
jgi:WD40 repeat protein